MIRMQTIAQLKNCLSHHKSTRKKQQIYKGKKITVIQVEVHFQHIT